MRKKMKSMKYFTVLILVLGMCQIVVAEKRVKPKPMKEFTDPSSPSYVPYPYPKNREEIIEDLKYAVKKLFIDKKGTYLDGKVPEIRQLLVKIVEKNSIYKIGEIIKVKNRNHRMADDYTWLILIKNPKGEIEARVSLLANGLMAGGGLTKHGAKFHKEKYPNSHWDPQHLMKDEDVVKRLSEDMGKTVGTHEIKKIERVGFQSSRLGSIYLPMFEIKMSSGGKYFYSVKTDEVYEIEEIKHWKKNKRGSRLAPWQLVPQGKNYVTDSINEEILVLKALKKKNKDNK
jgi:hypothetical protein